MEERAVELTAIKRRRGARGWLASESWEIGPERRLIDRGHSHRVVEKVFGENFVRYAERVWR
ncbi:hypothetical protein GCM10009789_85470 [Kribbella sancticallisti]|uniref:Uncharacterized protein n=1 Tax=Kribbella sancticallisti TaxID=460087 RepID=A0ABP4QSD4_9ACTN